MLSFLYIMPRKSLHSSINNLSYKSLLIILFFLLISIVVLWKFVLSNHKVEASWWNDGWNYRKAVSISNTSGSNLTDFQVSLSIGTSALIASGKMQSDCDDIRVTDINGNLLAYWIEENNPGCNQLTDTKIWIKANSLPTSGATVYLYYGNNSAPSAQSGDNTFEFFDDFNDGILDTNKWQALTTGNLDATLYWAETGGNLQINTSPNYSTITSKNFTIQNGIIETRYIGTTSSTDPDNDMLFVWRWQDYRNFYFFHHDYANPATTTCANLPSDNVNVSKYVNGTETCLTWIAAPSLNEYPNWYNAIIKFNGNDSSVNYSKYPSNWYNTTDTSFTNSGRVGLGKAHPEEHPKWDYFFVHKYTSVEPTATIQSEEAGGGPIAYWKFDEGSGTTAYDSTTNQNNGTISSATWQTEDQCISGKCLKFDGINDYINNPNSINNLNSMTIQLWFKTPNINAGGQYLLDGRNGGNWWFLQDYASGACTDTNGNICFNGLVEIPSSYLSNNKWYHVTLTTDSSSSKIYLNGKLINTGAAFTPSIGANLRIGTRYTTESFFNGFIDEPKIYPYARTAAQIKQDYNSRGSSKGTTANLGGAASDSNLSDGLVGYWKMDEGVGTTTADSSGNSNIGTFGTGSSAPSWSNGKFGIGTSFNGTNAYISLGQIKSIGAETYSFWFKSTSTSTGHVILATNATTSNYGISRIGDNLLFLRSGSNYQYFNNIAQYYDGQWHHLVITVPGGSQSDITNTKAYVDNKEMTKGSGTSSVAPGAYSNFYIATGSYGYFNGSIDEVRIYNRALSPAEVSQLYEFAPGPVGYWDFEENTGTTIKDKSGNGNTGTLYNSPTWTQGKIGSAIDLNGTNQYADITTSSSAIQGYGTFEIWFKPNNCSAANQSIFSQRYTGWHGRGIIISSNTISGWSRNGSATWQSVTLGSCVNNQWYHAVLTQEGNIIKGYLNGVFISSLDMTSSLDGSYLNYYTIGKYTNDSYFFDGTVDNVKIYNYARTQKQIIEDMNAGTPASSNKSPIAYWKFDEGSGTTTNNSGNGGSTFNTTFATGSSAPTWTNDGKSGKALNFDGVGNYALANSDPAYNLQEMTISAWVKADSVDKTGPIVGNAFGWWYRYGIFISGGTYTAFFRSTGGTWTLSSSVSSSPNNWDYVAVSYKDGTAKIYVNGKLRNSGIFTYAPLTQSSSTIMFGTHSISANNWFKGSLDEVKIYNYALTDEEVKQDYNQGSALQMGQTSQTISGTTTSLEYCIPGDTSPCASPVAEWNFEENTGTTTKDSSGNNNTGTFGIGNSAPTWTIGKKNTGAGLKFDGVNDYVNLGTPISLNSITYPLTISLWAKPTTLTQNGVILSLDVTDSNSDIAIGIYNTENKILIGRQTYQYGLTGISSYLTAGKWQHWEIVFTDTTHINFYLDGVQQTLSSVSNYWTPSQNNIGAKSNGSLYSFNGSIDGVKIYNYARTPAQVAYDYNKGDPIGWWKFDECQGSVANDSSGIGNTGSINIAASGTQTALGTCTTSGTAWGNGASGKINSSLNFDGTDDYVNIGRKENLNLIPGTNNFTVTGWFKTTNQGVVYSFGASSSIRQIQIDVNGAGTVEFYAGGVLLPYSSGYNDGKWHHITGVATTTTMFLYVDGVLKNSQAVGTGTDATYGAEIGSRTGGTGYLMNGQIDDVRVYNYALTSEQVKTLYNGGAVSFN